MEYNLNQDALTYQEGLQAYQQGLIAKSNKQAEYNQQAKDKDNEINEPLNFLTEALMGKPVKNIMSKAKEKGVQWVSGKIRSKLGQLGDQVRAQLPEGTSLEDVIKGENPVLPENTPQVVRDGVNKLRSALGKRPIQARGTDPSPRSEPESTEISEPPSNNLDNEALEYSDFPADSPVRNQPRINIRSINSKAEMQEARGNLERRYRNMDEGTQNKIQEKFTNDPTTSQNPEGDADALRQNLRNTQRYIRQAERDPETRFKSETPEDAPSDDTTGTDIQTAGSNPAPEDDTAPEPPEAPETEAGEGAEAVAGAEGTEAGAVAGATAGTEAEILGGAAASQGFLDPISDILALGGLVGALFGIGQHHSTPQQVQYTPLNPSIQHGI